MTIEGYITQMRTQSLDYLSPVQRTVTFAFCGGQHLTLPWEGPWPQIKDVQKQKWRFTIEPVAQDET